MMIAMTASFLALLLLVPWIAPPVGTPLPAVTITDLSYDLANDDAGRPEAARSSEPPTGAPPGSLEFSASALGDFQIIGRAEDVHGRMISTHDSRGPPARRRHLALLSLAFPTIDWACIFWGALAAAVVIGGVWLLIREPYQPCECMQCKDARELARRDP